MKILLKNPFILSMKDNEEIYKSDILIDDNKIVKIGLNLSSEDARVVDLTDCVLMPGFKNAHAHSAMVFARSSSDNLELQEWLKNCILPMEKKFFKDDIYNLTKVAILEYLTSGITACYDMYYAPEEIARASIDMGFKNVILLFPPEDSKEISKFKNEFKTFKNMGKDLIDVRIGCHSEYLKTEESLIAIKKLCDELKVPFSTHSSETLEEVQASLKRHQGLTPTAYFESLGLLDQGGVLFHNCYLADKDIEILKKHQVYCVTCPGSNAKLASGVAPISRLLKAGIKVAIGTDGAGSNNSLDMFKEMHLLYSLTKLKDQDATSLKAFDILKMATVNGALALGLNNSLYVDVNQTADLIAIDLNRPNMQPVNNIVYSGSKDNIKMTMINGKILYLDKKFYLKENIQELYQKAQEITDRLNQDNKYL